MGLVLLCGGPAVGKPTVAKVLAARTGARLFHNHMTVNLVLSIFDFGSPGFIDLREAIWTIVLRRALAERVPLLIFTFNPENTVPQRFIDELFSEFSAAGSEVISVELTAGEAVIEARIGSDSRSREGKTLDLDTYRVLRARGAFDSPVIRSPRLTLDNGKMTPLEAADRIAALL
jgi:hypothetical protein